MSYQKFSLQHFINIQYQAEKNFKKYQLEY